MNGHKRLWILLAGLTAVTVVVVIIVTDRNKQENNLNSPNACPGYSDSYRGMSESDAIAKTQKDNRPYRIASQDGKSYVLTADFSTERVNFDIRNGKVVKAECY